MTIDAILKDWSDYDRRKKACNTSVEYFDFNAEWEVAYLHKRIKNIYPFIPDTTIQNKVKDFAQEVRLPCERATCVKSVLIKLGIPL